MLDTRNVVTLNATIRPDQKAMLVSYGKHNGCISLSEALRAYLDEARTLMSIATQGTRPSQLEESPA